MRIASTEIIKSAMIYEFTAAEQEYYRLLSNSSDANLIKQQRLKCSQVLVVGAINIAAIVLQQIAIAGIGTIRIIDKTTLSSKHIDHALLCPSDMGRSAAQAVAQALQQLNPHIDIAPLATTISPNSIQDVIKPFDVIVCHSQQLAEHYLINDACVSQAKTVVMLHGSEEKAECLTFNGMGRPCLRCVHPNPLSLAQQTNPISLGTTPTIMGGYAANQVLRALQLNTDERVIISSAQAFDSNSSAFKELALTTYLNCPLCGRRKTFTDLHGHTFQPVPVEQSSLTLTEEAEEEKIR